ncbi:MAG: hypothetical protein ABFS42_12455 [Candidatus Krumholzibacteriota bacterium]
MDRKSGSTLVLAALMVALLAGTGMAAGEAEGGASAAGYMPAFDAPDTVRTNLWLTEALMSEIVASFTNVLPAPPAAVLMVNQGGLDGDDVFGGVASDILGSMGHEVFVVAADSTVQAPVDIVFDYKVVGVELSYPEVGRTLGIWQRWVARDVSVTASVELTEADSGRLLFKDIVTRRFADRVDNGDFDAVESPLYDFTSAETSGSGWQNRMEEIVVLGTLVGLIAVYFSNTGN